MKVHQFALRRGQTAAVAVLISTVAMVGVVATSPASAHRTPATVRPASVEDGPPEEEESVTLTWDKAGDNDLFLIGPDGEEITYRNSTPTGALSLDDIDPSGPETFTPTSAANGPFQVKVRCFHLCEGSTVTVNAVVRGEPVSLGSHTMTAEKEVWVAGTVDFNPNYYSGGMPTRSFNVKTVGINDTWVDIFDTSRHAWNTSGAGTNIGREASAWSTFTADHYPASWWGVYSPSGARTIISRRFDIRVNARTLLRDARPHSRYPLAVQSVTVHELGHALSLVDNPATTQPSIMKQGYVSLYLGSPAAYDVLQVRRIYS